MNNKIIKKSRTVNCSLHDVWQKWTTHEGLLTFFGRDNRIELKLGGPFEIYFLMDNPPGLKGSEGCKVLSFLPQRMLSYTWNAPPEYPEIRNHDHQTWVVIFFKPLGDNKTEVELNHLGWLTGEQWDAVYDYFDEAWESVLDRFEKSCAR
ncbi:MAG: SRPBCC domain-containing protein [candidate division WOR-3 bacterium]|nr:MAG: SRPBCC domain-containing protein [candidate division WOR-3 bacterium]